MNQLSKSNLKGITFSKLPFWLSLASLLIILIYLGGQKNVILNACLENSHPRGLGGVAYNDFVGLLKYYGAFFAAPLALHFFICFRKKIISTFFFISVIVANLLLLLNFHGYLSEYYYGDFPREVWNNLPTFTKKPHPLKEQLHDDFFNKGGELSLKLPSEAVAGILQADDACEIEDHHQGLYGWTCNSCLYVFEEDRTLGGFGLSFFSILIFYSYYMIYLIVVLIHRKLKRSNA